MIDWISLFTNALWVFGLALVLIAFSFAIYQSAETRTRLREQLGRPGFTAASALGLMFFSLGMAANSTRGWWESLLWLGLALAFGIQVWSAQRQRHGLDHDLRPVLRAWAASDAPIALSIIVLGVMLAILYALIIRPWMQPDEPRHFEVAQHVARLRKPVVYYPDRVLEWEQEIIADMEAQDFWWYGYSVSAWDPEQLPQSFDEIWGAQYGLAFFQQPLYYTLAGGLLASWDDALPLSEAVVRLRMLGVFLLALSLWGIYKIVREVFPQRPRLALIVLAIAALWPSHLAANATMNNDPLVELFVIWALYFAVHLIHRGPGLLNLTGLFLCGLLAMVSKRSGLTALGLFPAALFLWGLGRISGRWTVKRILLALGLLVVVIAAGGALALAALRTGRIYVPKDFTQALTTGAYWQELAEAPLGRFADVLLRTFVGWFGWLRQPLAEPLYWLGAIVLVLTLLGYLLYARPSLSLDLAGWQKRALLLLAGALLLQIGFILGKEIVYGLWRDGANPQARYLYPVFPSILILGVLGLAAFVPARLRPSALPIVLLLLLGFNVYVLAFVLYPFFWL